MTHKASWASTEHENSGTHLGADLVEPVSSARSGLEESGVNIREVLDLENTAGYKSHGQNASITLWGKNYF